MVTLDHTAHTHTRAPTKPIFVLLHRRSYWAASGAQWANVKTESVSSAYTCRIFPAALRATCNTWRDLTRMERAHE